MTNMHDLGDDAEEVELDRLREMAATNMQGLTDAELTRLREDAASYLARFKDLNLDRFNLDGDDGNAEIFAEHAAMITVGLWGDVVDAMDSGIAQMMNPLDDVVPTLEAVLRALDAEAARRQQRA